MGFAKLFGDAGKTTVIVAGLGIANWSIWSLAFNDKSRWSWLNYAENYVPLLAAFATGLASTRNSGVRSADHTSMVTPFGGVRSANPSMLASEPNGSFYSAAFETRLNLGSYPGMSRAAHFQGANEALLRLMEADADLLSR